MSTAFDGRGDAREKRSGEEWTAEVMAVDRFFLDTNGAISKKIFVVFADNKYRRT